MNKHPTTWQWDDVRFFLAVARTGSLSAAARTLRVGHVTVGRRTALLEKRLGVTLLSRTPDGFSTTPAGQAILQQCAAMETAALDLERIAAGRELTRQRHGSDHRDRGARPSARRPGNQRVAARTSRATDRPDRGRSVARHRTPRCRPRDQSCTTNRARACMPQARRSRLFALCVATLSSQTRRAKTRTGVRRLRRDHVHRCSGRGAPILYGRVAGGRARGGSLR